MTRRKFTSTFKTKVVLESLKEQKTIAELAQKHQVHPQQISNWKKEFLQGAEVVFAESKTSPKTEAEQERDQVLKVIGRLKVENDFLKMALR
jgi:transposase